MGAALALAALLLLPGQVEAVEPTFQLDRKRDVRGPLDIVRVAMSNRPDGSIRAELTMRREWDADDLGDDGSLCVKLYVKARPDSRPPEHLVCVTRSVGGALTGRVLRNRANGLPENAGEVAVTRPTERTVYLGFDPASIRHPNRLRFAGESVWRGHRRCPEASGCTDLAPDAPGARRFRLRRNTSSG